MQKIVIVEDDKEIREELKILLQNSGYEVKTIVNFENIDQAILEEQPHLVLLDINLPNKTGYEICTKVRTKSKIPIIFVTSRNNSMDELQGIMLRWRRLYRKTIQCAHFASKNQKSFKQNIFNGRTRTQNGV